MSEIRELMAELVADTTKAQNTDFLAADVQLRRGTSFLRITIVSQDAKKIRLVPNTGTGFYLNNGDALVAAAVIVNDIPVDQGRTWNIQTDDAAGDTLSMLKIEEIADSEDRS